MLPQYIPWTEEDDAWMDAYFDELRREQELQESQLAPEELAQELWEEQHRYQLEDQERERLLRAVRAELVSFQES